MKINLSFSTCTMMEAIEEINISLKNANYPLITENDLIETKPVEKTDPDDFDDYRFTFKTEINDTIENIREKLPAIDIDEE